MVQETLRDMKNPYVPELAKITGITPVSYTHLDVYKRQRQGRESAGDG